MGGTVGIIANPAAGRDVRRLLAHAGTSSLNDKVTTVRRLAIGALHEGVDRFVVLPDHMRLGERAFATVEHGATVEMLDIQPLGNEGDTVRGAALMRDAGVDVLVVLGGDGTSRAAALGWPDAPLMALSTGTNNAFPVLVEPTPAGMAAGLVATGSVPIERVARRCKIVQVEIDGERDDLALIDVLVVDDDIVGSMRLFEAHRMHCAVLTRAEPAAVGISAIGARLAEVSPEDDRGLLVRFGAGGVDIAAPVAPGHVERVAVDDWRFLDAGDVVEVDGPGLLAFDGERRRRLRGGQQARLRVVRHGPRVIDIVATLRCARAG